MKRSKVELQTSKPPKNSHLLGLQGPQQTPAHKYKLLYINRKLPYCEILYGVNHYIAYKGPTDWESIDRRFSFDQHQTNYVRLVST